ncbi:MAG: hypothetical protein CBB96_05535 [Gammaproteobacteria bacterium TMED36]|nr:MAG: hypothetical protein CBB96_05535 [Gammaproteobacteria bacterium TMED36]|tara:strand:+ start:1353 stop:1568 length:216 start_codon:yes stop_codon:yes gene_type:complete
MKKFKQLREAKKKRMPPGDHVYDKKISGVEVMVHKEKGKFVLYIDGDKLDDFPNLNTAKKAGDEFVKQAKG